MSTIDIEWGVSDGFVGPQAWHHTTIYLSEAQECEDDGSLEALLEECIADDFRDSVHPYLREGTLEKVREAIAALPPEEY